MRMDKMTLKAQDAINTAQNIATDMNHYEIQPEHLLLALIDQEGGIFGSIAQKIGAQLNELRSEADAAVKALPRQVGAGPGGGVAVIRPAGHPERGVERGGGPQGRVPEHGAHDPRACLQGERQGAEDPERARLHPRQYPEGAERYPREQARRRRDAPRTSTTPWTGTAGT